MTTSSYKGPKALSNAHVLAAILRPYGFDQILLPKVSKLTRSIESIINNVTIEFRSSDPELRLVRIFANDEGIYLAPRWKHAIPIEKTTIDFLIVVLNSTHLYTWPKS